MHLFACTYSICAVTKEATDTCSSEMRNNESSGENQHNQIKLNSTYTLNLPEDEYQLFVIMPCLRVPCWVIFVF